MISFNSKVAARLAGMSFRRLDYLDRSHLIKPSIREATGKGSARLYSFKDLVQLRVAAALREQGLSLQKIRKCVSFLKKTLDVEQPLAELKLVTDGQSIFYWVKEAGGFADALKGGQLVFLIPVDEFIRQLRGQVEALAAERAYTVTVKGRKFRAVLHPDLEAGGFWVEAPELPGCVSQGETVEEALEMIEDAITGWLEVDAELRAKNKKAEGE
ncbi:MAG: MerR family transcriptional regulator [Pseudomonadota bacterium]